MRFTPTSSKFANEECGGVFMIVTDRSAMHPVRVGVEVASALNKLYAAKFELESADRLFGSKEGLARIRAGADPNEPDFDPRRDRGELGRRAGVSCERNTCSIDRALNH